MAEKIAVPIHEIREEFATCEICLDYFDIEKRTPRTLPCLHTFCYSCLDKLWGPGKQGLECPKCRRIWPVSESIKASFQQNNMLVHMVEYIDFKKRFGDLLCFQCPDKNKAVVRCQECEKYFCETCEKLHARFNERHKTVTLAELANSPQTFLKHTSMCCVHDDKKLDVYCDSEMCKKAVCTTCALVSHKEHEICDLKKVSHDKKENVLSSLESMKTASELRKEYKEKLLQQNGDLDKMQKEVLEDIKNHTKKLIDRVEQRSKELIDLITENITKQKAKRDEQIKLVDKSEKLSEEHILYSQQALSFAQDVDFVEMAETLERKGKSFLEDLQMPNLNVEKISLDKDACDSLHNSIGEISIHVGKSCSTTYGGHGRKQKDQSCDTYYDEYGIQEEDQSCDSYYDEYGIQEEGKYCSTTYGGYGRKQKATAGITDVSVPAKKPMIPDQICDNYYEVCDIQDEDQSCDSYYDEYGIQEEDQSCDAYYDEYDIQEEETSDKSNY